MKNYNSKENKYTDIQSEDIRKRTKECQNHHREGITVKELAAPVLNLEVEKYKTKILLK